MNNFISLFVAMLENIELLTADEARKLVKELHTTTLPDNYDQAARVVRELFTKHQVKTLSDKVSPAPPSAAAKK